MKRRILVWLLGMLPALAGAAISWQPWSPALFEQARQQHKLVLLNLAAGWCHWCHVMDHNTYSDPRVTAYLQQHYLTIKVDQDSRPDLANRYRDYGWPATVIFLPDGSELVKRAGYIDPDAFLSLLQTVAENPAPLTDTPTTRPVTQHALSDTLRHSLEERHRKSYDQTHGGLKLAQKFLDADSVEYMLLQARLGDGTEGERARQTLNSAARLIDPVWGGAYQYSTGGDWHYPHFEKIMSVQADYLRLYSLAYAQWQAPEDLARARAIRDYLLTFLRSPEGAFYTSQDADPIPGQHGADYFALNDADRRRAGIPHIDTHRYSRENGWASEALVQLYQASGDKQALQAAVQSMDWVLAHRRLPGGGFRHDQQDPAGPYLADSLAAGKACLALYQATAQRRWLACATQAADFIHDRFASAAGVVTAVKAPDSPLQPTADIEENIHLARFANRLYQYTGKEDNRMLARQAMGFLATPAVAKARIEDAGILLADRELGQAPAHYTVVGHRDATTAAALFEVALRQPGSYKRIEWWDRRDGPLPRGDVDYPTTGKAAGYFCTDSRCSLPAFDAQHYQALINRLRQ
ncbi:hypothetical protein A11A3_06898 [Alcanivorax hongdengensis A-11-3]|uniref:Thioredoxin domain-containing protein n=1 Tax=Alcanivorax hongdengensis A-11-3 TaxID=1177179 RepID=L0WFX7_9GAMM|nr:DUF255 domain-containing protein [Alcanivorax hongdengensis]EKF74730.1 hypothetical protein A11A3_06898 [Alcanivorax hongdengensis A-11-3]